MELPVTFHNKIVEFLTSLPNIHDSNAQRALIHSASLDARLQSEIHFGGSSQQFFQLLIPTLRSYGNLADNRDPLKAVLEAAKVDDGSSRRTECDRHAALCAIFIRYSTVVTLYTILRHSTTHGGFKRKASICLRFFFMKCAILHEDMRLCFSRDDKA